MPHPIVCIDARFRQYLEHWQVLFSRPHYQHFVTVLLALIVGTQGFTLWHLKRAVAGSKSLSSLSRFIARAPWDQKLLHALAWSRFVDHMQPSLQQDLSRQRALQPVRQGRPRKLFVTGYLIGDDSTIGKRFRACQPLHMCHVSGRAITSIRCGCIPWPVRSRACIAAS